MSCFSHVGSESELPRSLSLGQMSMVGFGAVISFGLVSGAVFPLALSGAAAILAYLGAAAMLVLLISCTATLTLSGVAPKSFGEAISHQLGRGAATFTRGAYFLTVTAIVGTEIAFLAPALRPWMPWLPAWLAGLLGLLFLALVIGYGARAFARLEVLLAVIKIGAVIGLLAMSCRVIWAGDDLPALGAGWLQGVLRADAGALWTSFVLATLGFVGIESLSLAARETMAAPPVLRARMVAVARWLALLVWVTVAITGMLVHTGAVPLHQLPSQYLLTLLSKSHAHLLFGALVAVTVLSVVNSQLYGATRTLHEASRAGELPKCLSRLDAGSPRVATLVAVLCAVAVFLAVSYDPQDIFKIATVTATTGALAVWAMIFMAALSFTLSDTGWGPYAKAKGKRWLLNGWRAFLGLAVTLLIAIALPFMEFFRPAIWAGVPPLLAVGIGAVVLDAHRRRNNNRMD